LTDRLSAAPSPPDAQQPLLPKAVWNSPNTVFLFLLCVHIQAYLPLPDFSFGCVTGFVFLFALRFFYLRLVVGGGLLALSGLSALDTGGNNPRPGGVPWPVIVRAPVPTEWLRRSEFIPCLPAPFFCLKAVSCFPFQASHFRSPSSFAVRQSCLYG